MSFSESLSDSFSPSFGKSFGKGFVPSDVTQEDADSLIDFYTETGGASWTSKTNWLTDTTVANWQYVTVSGGRVTKLLITSANNLVGSLTGWIAPTALTDFRVQSQGANLTGDLSSFSWPSSLTYVNLAANTFSGNLSGVTWPAGLQYLYLNTNTFSGDMSGVSWPASLVQLVLQISSFSGDMSGVTWPALLEYLYLFSNTFSGAITPPNKIKDVRYYTMTPALSQAAVNTTVDNIWTKRANYTHTTPIILNIAGTNPGPTGTYQAPADCGVGPASQLEKVYELVNDSCAAGFKKWAVTY